MHSPARTDAELHECRQCCGFCDRVVYPSGCIQSGCPYLYLYDDENTGHRYMGCMHKVFRGEIDVELFEQAERTRQGFGGVKVTGMPRRPAGCPSSAPTTAAASRSTASTRASSRRRRPADPAFDLRDSL